jgi:DNA polymerase I-like protein with 3'-5' exonuclease and polymerase domains
VPLIVHDEVNVFVPEDNWYEHYLKIHKMMTSWDFDFINVPVESDASIGYNWYQLMDVNDILR